MAAAARSAPLDFRFLDEGLGGQGKKRKRMAEEALVLQAHAAAAAGGSMEVDAEAGGPPGEGGLPGARGSVPGEGAQGEKRQRRELARTVNAGKASGRPWKEPKRRRASAMATAASATQQRKVASAEERGRQRALDKAFRERKEELKEEIRAAKREKRLRAEEKKRRKEANALKGAKLQVISNPRTLKKMSKKQLKQLVRIPG